MELSSQMYLTKSQDSNIYSRISLFGQYKKPLACIFSFNIHKKINKQIRQQPNVVSSGGNGIF